MTDDLATNYFYLRPADVGSDAYLGWDESPEILEYGLLYQAYQCPRFLYSIDIPFSTMSFFNRRITYPTYHQHLGMREVLGFLKIYGLSEYRDFDKNQKLEDFVRKYPPEEMRKKAIAESTDIDALSHLMHRCNTDNLKYIALGRGKTLIKVLKGLKNLLSNAVKFEQIDTTCKVVYRYKNNFRNRGFSENSPIGKEDWFYEKDYRKDNLLFTAESAKKFPFPNSHTETHPACRKIFFYLANGLFLGRRSDTIRYFTDTEYRYLKGLYSFFEYKLDGLVVFGLINKDPANVNHDLGGYTTFDFEKISITRNEALKAMIQSCTDVMYLQYLIERCNTEELKNTVDKRIDKLIEIIEKISYTPSIKNTYVWRFSDA